MKRLRKHVQKTTGSTVKFFHSGEYGDEFKRPHYHALIFGYDFHDRSVWKVRNDIPIYISPTLDTLWGKGFATCGDVTYESAAYCARYVLKKVKGAGKYVPDEKTGLLPYERCDRISGDVVQVEEEYCTMSRGGRNGRGLAFDFVSDYLDDIYPWDECVVNGALLRPPRYYDNVYQIDHPDDMEDIKQRRIQVMERHMADNTRARLTTKEVVKKAQITNLKREVE